MKKYVRLSFLWFFLGRSIVAQEESFSLVFSQGTRCFHECATKIPEVFTVGEWSCTVDVPALKAEVIELLDLVPGERLTRSEFFDRLQRCQKQKRFLRADVALAMTDSCCNGTLAFVSGTVLERVDITGTLIGKDKYRHAYTIKPGELFEGEAHEAGLEKIKNMLHKEGYWGGSVSATLTKNEAFNTACVTINLLQGSCYRIGAARIARLVCPEAMHELEYKKMRAALERVFRANLEHTFYSALALNNAIEALRKLLQSDGFWAPVIRLKERVDHEACEVALSLAIEPGARNLFLWYGNRFFSSSQLLEHLQNFGSSLSFIPAPLLAEELVALYKRHGFWDVAITWREDGPRTYFFITEGCVACIDAIEFEGVTACPASVLIKRYGSPLVGEPFNATKVTAFLAQITEHYLHAGFWDVAVDHYEYTPLSPGHYVLKVTVREGGQRWLAEVTSDIPCAVSESAQPFDIRIIQNQRHKLVRWLRRCGKLYATPVPELHEQDPYRLKLHWRCQGLQDPVVFGKTIVRGNGSLPTAHILRECTYYEGDVWDQEQLYATLSRIRSLGIFDVVSLVPDDVCAPSPVKDVVLECVPDAPYEIRTRVGVQGVNRNVVLWNGGASPKLGLSFLARNPAGICDLFRADVDYTRYMHDVVFSYKIPWIHTTRVGLELQGISSRYDQPVYIGSPQVLYRASHDGFLVGTGKTFGILTGGVSLSAAQIGIKATTCDGCPVGVGACNRSLVIARALDVSPLLLVTKPWYLILDATTMIDNRDDKVNPHYGSLTVLSLKGIVPPALRDGSFIKGVLESSWFASYHDWVVGVRFRVGMLGGAHFDRIMPMERFYLGGPYSLRCYESDYAPPLASFITCKGCTCLVPTGGKYMVNMNAELRFPLYKQLVGGVVFVDGGSLSCASPYTLVAPHNLMGAVGVGLRINTPVGPVRGDIGWRLHRDCSVNGAKVNSRSFAWFITLGHAF